MGNINFGFKKDKDGDPFKIARIFISVDEMESEYSGNTLLAGPKVNKGEYVIINTEDKSDPDNGKLYFKGDTEYEYVANLSGPKGDKGNPFKVARTFISVDEMESEYSGNTLLAGPKVNKGEYVIINTEDKSDPDNGKLYFKGDTEYEYVANLSGPKGDKGDSGDGIMVGTSLQDATQKKLVLIVEE